MGDGARLVMPVPEPALRVAERRGLVPKGLAPRAVGDTAELGGGDGGDGGDCTFKC